MARRSMLNDDQNRWEKNILRRAGVVRNKTVSLEIENEAEQRVTLMVRNIRPPFLDGRVSFSKQKDMVSVVKDRTSDFATIARNGSELMKSARQRQEKMKMRKRFWELGGSRMGNAIGIVAEESHDEEEDGQARLIDGGKKEIMKRKNDLNPN
eukprot:g8777.t1